MTKTLYLEGEFPSQLDVNPFFSKLIRTKKRVLFVSDLVTDEHRSFVKSKSPELDIRFSTQDEILKVIYKHDSLERAVIELDNIFDGLLNYDLFIEDRDGSLEKILITTLMNYKFENAYIMARSIDWTPSSKSTMTKAFDCIMISKTNIVSEQELFKYVSIFPDSEEALIHWIETSVQLSANSYYGFLKKTSNEKVPLFMVLDGKSRNFITEGYQAVSITSKKDNSQFVTDKLLELSVAIEYIANTLDQQQEQVHDRVDEKDSLADKMHELLLNFNKLQHDFRMVSDLENEPFDNLENTNTKYKLDDLFEKGSPVEPVVVQESSNKEPDEPDEPDTNNSNDAEGPPVVSTENKKPLKISAFAKEDTEAF